MKASKALVLIALATFLIVFFSSLNAANSASTLCSYQTATGSQFSYNGAATLINSASIGKLDHKQPRSANSIGQLEAAKQEEAGTILDQLAMLDQAPKLCREISIK